MSFLKHIHYIISFGLDVKEEEIMASLTCFLRLLGFHPGGSNKLMHCMIFSLDINEDKEIPAAAAAPSSGDAAQLVETAGDVSSSLF
jgi:hypothetical protein